MARATVFNQDATAQACSFESAGFKWLHVVDLKLHMTVRWFAGGKVDYIPATIFAGYPKLVRLHDAVRDHAGVKAWYAKT